MNNFFAEPKIEIILFAAESIVTASRMYNNEDSGEDSGDFGNLFGGN
ncbi:MAG: hypothetical protein IKX06_04910 [Clostridia bacterium]|nr:hypothetical protein [Clostridia bacterium]